MSGKWLHLGKQPDHDDIRLQYVKEENLTIGEHGKEARATRLITERASRRIGQMAFELALARSRKVCGKY